MQTTIQTFPQLIDWLHENDVTPEQVQEIVHATIGAYFTAPGTKDELLQHLVKFWGEYGHRQETPIFINA